jgi:hypothetical protein
MKWMKHGEHSMQGRHGARDERRGAWLGEAEAAARGSRGQAECGVPNFRDH